MYRIHHNGQLSIEEFHVPFGCTLDNAYMQFFFGFAAYSSKAPFDPSTMLHFR
jgi:hypothetical protein